MLGREPAVNRQAHAVDVSRPRAREINDEPSDLVSISDTLFRAYVRNPRPIHFVPRSHVRPRRTGLDVDDGDLLLRKVEGETMHEPGNCCFRYSVDSCARDERAARRVAADNDHLAAGRQMTSGSLRCDKHAPYVDRDHLVKVGKRVVGYVPVDQDARVVHEDIQPAERFCGPIDGTVQRLGIGAVGVQRGRAATCIFDARHKRLSRRPTTRVGERHRCSLVREVPHDGSADAARAPDDQRLFSLQRFSAHRISFYGTYIPEYPSRNVWAATAGLRLSFATQAAYGEGRYVA